MLDLHLDTSTPTSRFTLTILAAVAELEREQIRDEGAPWRKVADVLQVKGFRTQNGKAFTGSSARRAVLAVERDREAAEIRRQLSADQ